MTNAEMTKTGDEINGLDHVVCYVDNKQEAMKFYGEVLGLKLHGDYEDVVFYELGDKKFGLMLCPVSRQPGKHVELQPVRTGFSFRVNSIDTFTQKLKDHAVKLIGEPFQVGDSGDYFLSFYDPSGNVLEVVGQQ